MATQSEAAQTSFDGTVRSGISHGLEDPWKHIGDLAPGLVQGLLGSPSRKTFVVRTQGSSSSSAAVHLSTLRTTVGKGIEAHHIWVIWINSHVCEWVETGHKPISQMAIQLSERVVYILPCLHIWQRLRSRGLRR